MKHQNNNRRVVIRILFLLTILFYCVLPNVGHSQMLEGIRPWSNLVAIVRGEHLRAIMVAYDDFSKLVNQQKAKEMEAKYGERSLTAYSARIENYMIGIREGSKEYVVFFELKKHDNLTGVMGDGGLTGYLIDKNTFQIIKVDRGGK